MHTLAAFESPRHGSLTVSRDDHAGLPFVLQTAGVSGLTKCHRFPGPCELMAAVNSILVTHLGCFRQTSGRPLSTIMGDA